LNHKPAVEIEFDEPDREIAPLPDWLDQNAYPDPVKTSAKQWGWEFLRRNPGYRGDWLWNNDHRGEYGLLEVIDPGISPCEPRVHKTQIKIRSYSEGMHVLSLNKSQIAVAFYLHLPITDQINQTRVLLRKYSKLSPRFRMRSDRYRDYLRILDGRSAGSTHTEIARVLYPGKSAYEQKNQEKKDFDAARRLSWFDYEYLLQYPSGAK
jgi:hypothetical protein